MLRERRGDAWPVLPVSWLDSLQQRHRTVRAEHQFRLSLVITVGNQCK